MKILLVDDHILFREGLAGLIIAKTNFELVGGANNLREAIEQTRKFKPDLILMDFSLPDGTGLEATRSILAERPETKIVFMTIHEDDTHLFAAIRGGAKGYLPKSIPVEELLIYLQRLEHGEPALTPELTGRILDRLADTQPRRPARSSIEASLTPRELEVLKELVKGYSNHEIACNLSISVRTVKNHVGHILSKLELKSRYEAVDLAKRAGLVDERS